MMGVLVSGIILYCEINLSAATLRNFAFRSVAGTPLYYHPSGGAFKCSPLCHAAKFLFVSHEMLRE